MRRSGWHRRALAAALIVVGCDEPAPPPTPEVPSPAPVEASLPPPRAVERPPAPPRDDGPVAEVDGVPIPRAAFDELDLLATMKADARGNDLSPYSGERRRTRIVERLVHEERLRRRVVELGVDVDPAKLERRRAEQQGTMTPGAWFRYLDRRGESDDTLRAKLLAELREELILEQTGRLAVSRAELEAEYEAIEPEWVSPRPRIRASYIYVKIQPMVEAPTPEQRAAALAEAERMRARVTAPGADFLAIATEPWVSPTERQGGDLGILTPDDIFPIFWKAASRMKVGQISKPIDVKAGYYLIHLTGRWPPGVLPIEALEPDIVKRLRKKKLEQGRRELKAELEAEYPVTHYLLAPEE